MYSGLYNMVILWIKQTITILNVCVLSSLGI